ncbi:hypothetical protein PRIPAC_76127, partial [Pristionchus pacificus]
EFLLNGQLNFLICLLPLQSIDPLLRIYSWRRLYCQKFRRFYHLPSQESSHLC